MAETSSGKSLIIVESPTKAKTISKFVGQNYEVLSSYGHVRDLPKSKLGIDVEHDFAPQYIVPPKAKPVVKELKKKAKKAKSVILATDEDREGEAIAWHLTEALGIKKNSERIVFHEITKPAILDALTHPRSIDMRLVDAQQARRILDRLVGYGLSPFLWRKIRYGLSAGRVQSAALRLVVEREREIQKFRREEYWTIESRFKGKKGKPFPAALVSFEDKALPKMAIGSEARAKEILEALKGASYRVAAVAKKEISRNPAPPFTTSTLQQEAARKLGFSAKQTMMIAQGLYERGFITYMRTDSVHLAASAEAEAQLVIERHFGKEYGLPGPRRFSVKSKGAQEAHEAVRPTSFASQGRDLGLTARDLRLYDLIWKRAIASQMREASLERTSADIEASKGGAAFRATGQVVKFDGFIRAYTEGKDEPDDDSENILPPLEEGEALKAESISPIQHFTEPPARYTDATLVKALEAEGVGRPSTYAPTLSTIQERGYVEKIEKKYQPTEIGFLVNDFLVEHFPQIVDLKFTSHVEEELDGVAEGKIGWVEVSREFYDPFKKHLDEKEATVGKYTETSDTPCPHCQKPMIVKFGRFGKFLACPDPEVKVTLPMPEEAAKIKELEEKTKGERCPLCGKKMDVKRGRFGFFLGCSDYPACKGIMKIWNKTGFKCPNCRARITERDGERSRATDEANPASSNIEPRTSNVVGDIVEKRGRGRGKPFYACTRYPDCTFVMNKKPESEAELEAAFAAWKEKPPATAKKPAAKTKRNQKKEAAESEEK